MKILVNGYGMGKDGWSCQQCEGQYHDCKTNFACEGNYWNCPHDFCGSQWI